MTPGHLTLPGGPCGFALYEDKGGGVAKTVNDRAPVCGLLQPPGCRVRAAHTRPL